MSYCVVCVRVCACRLLYWYWEQNHPEGDLHLIYQVSGLYQREEEGKSHMMIVTLADEREIDGRE